MKHYNTWLNAHDDVYFLSLEKGNSLMSQLLRLRWLHQRTTKGLRCSLMELAYERRGLFKEAFYVSKKI
ncbi:hypothetical protein RJT34_13611 [Clitoria ternatea]|uniref:Uncharacterized protein n=1 Tax=Clitoria ternatea TaxID=43366 RepID=A0AAN9JNV2_CLITE